MRAAVGGVCAYLTATLLVAGCGTASTSESSWLYIGPDEELGTWPTSVSPEMRRRIAEELRDKPKGTRSEILQARLNQDVNAWQRKVLATMEASKAVCRRETGDSGERHFWTGYDPAFLDCMKAQGWSRPTGTNPL